MGGTVPFRPPSPMFYRKRHHLPYAEKRFQERVTLPDADCLVVQVQLAEGETLHGELIDLTIGGAGIRVPKDAADTSPEDLGHLLLAHPIDGWEVKTPVRLTRATPDGPEHVMLGYQFINEGNLYAQLENAMARYFNRRQTTRVTPELDEQLPITVKWGPHRVHGRIQDLSVEGVGFAIPLVSAMHVETGTSVQLRFELPGNREPFDLEARVMRMQRMEDKVFLGLRFEADPETREYEGRDAIQAYVDQRRSDLEEWESGFAA